MWANRNLTVLALTGPLVLMAAPAAKASDMEALAAEPQNFLEQEVEVKAICVKGGRSGDVLGYECKTKNGVYVTADDVTPEEAKKKLDAECGQDGCEADVTFTPYSYSTSGVVEPDKSVVIFNAKSAKIGF